MTSGFLCGLAGWESVEPPWSLRSPLVARDSLASPPRVRSPMFFPVPDVRLPQSSRCASPRPSTTTLCQALPTFECPHPPSSSSPMPARIAERGLFRLVWLRSDSVADAWRCIAHFATGDYATGMPPARAQWLRSLRGDTRPRARCARIAASPGVTSERLKGESRGSPDCGRGRGPDPGSDGLGQ